MLALRDFLSAVMNEKLKLNLNDSSLRDARIDLIFYRTLHILNNYWLNPRRDTKIRTTFDAILPLSNYKIGKFLSEVIDILKSDSSIESREGKKYC